MSDVPPRPRIRPATSDDWVPTDRSGRGAQARPQGQ
ncbi:protein kinase, partial [Burkholderia multivorans]